jgi:hypothetical protein
VVRDAVEAPTRDPLGALGALGRPLVASTDPVTIKVAFHVVARDRTAEGGWVADEQLAAQLAVLNASFAGTSGGAATRFAFALRSVDRTVNEEWFAHEVSSKAEREMKRELRVGRARVLNVYVVDVQQGSLGWATYPWRYADNPIGDGALVDFEALPGGAKDAYDEGDTLVHETGHWLGLFHTFANGCEEPGDGVADTPAEASPSYGCDGTRDTCEAEGLDPVANFMDYSLDACMVGFTLGQAERMSAAWDAYRA